jgi:hypothetical protein
MFMDKEIYIRNIVKLSGELSICDESIVGGEITIDRGHVIDDKISN